MGKLLYITEKPSVAREFAKALKIQVNKQDGYLESSEAVITWCVGHLVTMSYPEKYDIKYKRWRLEELPFLPRDYKYEVIGNVKKQFNVVRNLLTRKDIHTIYVCTDSGREGEYIYRLVDQAAEVGNKDKRRVWIDSQTEEEILRGINEAKDLKEYDNLAASAYLRAKEDYLMGINFSRLLTLKYGPSISRYLEANHTVIAVGRVMTCVLGMVVRREREIRSFVKTPFYRILGDFKCEEIKFEGEWKAIEGSKYYNSPLLYKDNGFKEEKDANNLIDYLKDNNIPIQATVSDISKKKENRYPPLLYNLAELQNEVSKVLKLSPDQTLEIAQQLYEKKLVTYPRTDARVLSTAVAKEIYKNIKGLTQYNTLQKETEYVLSGNAYKNLSKTKYVDDKKITDHYAIIPTGQGLGSLNSLNSNARKVYDMIARRFIAIFYPPAVYQKLSIETIIKTEKFYSNFKVCIERGFLNVLEIEKQEQENNVDINAFKQLRKGTKLIAEELRIKAGETTPPKRYNSGNIILAMENAGQLIEDEQLREQIKGSGIGTSATRAEILKKLIKIKYISLNTKTQIITPTGLGEMIFDVVESSINSLLNAELTASWEKGLEMVANGEINEEIYMDKLENYIRNKVFNVIQVNNNNGLVSKFDAIPGDLIENDKKRIKKTNATTQKENNKTKNSLGVCIACNNGNILENSKAYYCDRWREGCRFTIWKNSLETYGKQLTKEMITQLCKDKVIKNLQITLPQTMEKGVADLEFRSDKSGALELKNFKRQ